MGKTGAWRGLRARAREGRGREVGVGREGRLEGDAGMEGGRYGGEGGRG